TIKRYKEPVRVRVPKELASELERFPRLCRWLVPNPITMRPYGDIGKTIDRACRLAGVGRFTMHDLKHLGITEALRASNGDVDLVSRLSATSPRLIAERYGHILGRGDHVVQGVATNIYQLVAI
ncbi:MAG: hypothetical protein KDC35_05025, partial [Acidobacteria bacterium]|nr:hypothetical protein [Acidobacteriota bacterium]